MNVNPRAALRTAVRVSLITALVLSLTAARAGRAASDDWPQWRGPNRDGVVASYTRPKSWPEQLRRKWKVTVGAGHSSPVVGGGRVYMLTRQGEEEVVTALDLSTGRQRWQNKYATAKYVVHEAAREHGDGPKATPVLHGGKLFTLGVTGVISAFDAASGKLLWRKEPVGGLGAAYPRFGMAISPLVARGVLVAAVGGNRESAAIAGFDTQTGREKWRWTDDRMHPEDGPEYSSPIMVEVGGAPHVVTIGGKKMVGLAPDTGRVLWQYPFEADWESTVTPLAHNGLIIASGHAIGMHAVRVSRRGGAWGVEKVWQNPDLFTFMNSPVTHGDLLFGQAILKKGHYFCADVNTGKTHWASEGRQGEYAAMIRAGEELFVLTPDATLTVARSSATGFEPLRRYQVADSPTWAHPVLLDKQMLVKDATALTLWSFE